MATRAKTTEEKIKDHIRAGLNVSKSPSPRKKFGRPANIETLNRDLSRTPVEIKGRHIKTGDFPTVTVSQNWIMTKGWAVKRELLSLGSILSHDWLRVKELGLVDGDRTLLLSTLFGVKNGDVSFRVAASEPSPLNLRPQDFDRFTKTKSSYTEDWAVYVIFKSKESGQFVGVDSRWVELFGLHSVWRVKSAIKGDFPALYDHPDQAKVSVILGRSGSIPKEAAVYAIPVEEPGS